MGPVTEALDDVLRREPEARSTVVWHDPEQAYLDVARSMTPEQLADAEVHRYEPERGFIWLRRQLEPLWTGRAARFRVPRGEVAPLRQSRTGSPVGSPDCQSFLLSAREDR
jgi:hypothetical protein